MKAAVRFLKRTAASFYLSHIFRGSGTAVTGGSVPAPAIHSPERAALKRAVTLCGLLAVS